MKHHAWLTSPHAITGFEIREDGACIIETRNGMRVDCPLRPTRSVSARLTLFNFNQQGGRGVRHLVIFPDTIEAEDYLPAGLAVLEILGGARFGYIA